MQVSHERQGGGKAWQQLNKFAQGKKGWAGAGQNKKEQVLNHKRKLYASYKRLLKREGLDEKSGGQAVEGDAVSGDEDDPRAPRKKGRGARGDAMEGGDGGLGMESASEEEAAGSGDDVEADEDSDQEGGRPTSGRQHQAHDSVVKGGGDGQATEGRRRRPPKSDPLKKARMVAEAKRREIEEAKRVKKEKEEAKLRSEKKRKERFRQMTKKTRRGQPLMKNQMSALLEKIKSTS